MRSFVEIVAQGEAMRASHHERLAELTRAHYARHPECKNVIAGMDDEGNVTRLAGVEIDIEARCRAGWFTREMWRGQGDRPIEAEIAQPTGHPMWQMGEAEAPVSIVGLMQREYLPALLAAHQRGELNQYNSYNMAKPAFERLMQRHMRRYGLPVPVQSG